MIFWHWPKKTEIAVSDGHNRLKHWNQPLDDNFLLNLKQFSYFQKNFRIEKNFEIEKIFKVRMTKNWMNLHTRSVKDQNNELVTFKKFPHL